VLLGVVALLLPGAAARGGGRGIVVCLLVLHCYYMFQNANPAFIKDPILTLLLPDFLLTR
jgi:hypothetical protein